MGLLSGIIKGAVKVTTAPLTVVEDTVSALQGKDASKTKQQLTEAIEDVEEGAEDSMQQLKDLLGL